MTTNNEALHNQLEQYVAERQQWLQEAVELIGSEGQRIEDVFPEPSKEKDQARRDTEHLNLDPSVEAPLREIAGRFGIGGESDVTLAEQGFAPGHINIFEGGLAWKMQAEAQLAGDAGTYIFAATKNRATKPEERTYLAATPETECDTEYDVARIVARSMEDFVAFDKPLVLPFGYDIHNNFAVFTGTTGQFEQIGTKNGRPVIMLRIDREELPEGKYQKQPDTAAIMGIVADVLAICGDDETAVGVTTSNTYASRAIDAVRAGQARGRHFGVAMYGRQTLAGVKNETVASPTELFQIPGELRVMHDKLQSLKAELEN